MGGDERGGEGWLNVMVGPLGENFGFGCVSEVAFLAPIARGKEAG